MKGRRGGGGGFQATGNTPGYRPEVCVHLTLLSILFQVNSVRGVAIVVKFGMNLL